MTTESTIELTDIARDFGAVCSAPATLADYTTFRLGGRCSLLIECPLPMQLEAVVKALHERHAGFVLIGGGSNLLVADAGVNEIVVRYLTDDAEIQRCGDELTVSGATSLDELAAFAVAAGLGGLVNTTGIPGTVGGAIVGNAGAFGWQVGDALVWVDLLDRQGERRRAAPAAIGFSYRNSGLKQTGEIVLAARFRLPEVTPQELGTQRNEILHLRASKHPDLGVDASAGSFFRNIEPTSAAARRQAAGWFLEQAGAKAMGVGGAAVFHKHANIIIKGRPDCTARDVLELSRRMAAAVGDRFGLELVREVTLLGEMGA